MTIDTDILIVGGGPVGMVAAYMLSHLGQRCTLVEQSKTTTQHPKMEFTNHRTMEIYRRIGLLGRVRARAVPEQYSLNELFTTGFGPHGMLINTWERESPAELRRKWAELNDGSCGLEPYMRQNQISFEQLMKEIIQKEPLIDSYWEFDFISLVEDEEYVVANIIDPARREIQIKSKYLIGCDGGGSRVRASAGIKSPRSLLPLGMVSVHFKSKELLGLLTQGQFWHALSASGANIVNQDECELWTALQTMPPDGDLTATLDAAFEAIEPRSFVYSCFGGMGPPLEFTIDEIMAKSKWRADVAVAESFRSTKGRVLLAGDAAHQTSPAGGNGFNSGIQDVYDLTWKLVAVLRGWGGITLLDSYTFERRKTAQLNVRTAEKAISTFVPIAMTSQSLGAQALIAKDAEGRKVRQELKVQHDKLYWLHHQDGVTMGYRYSGSPIVIPDDSTPEPAGPQPELDEDVKTVAEYVPSTWPGGRAPHVFLKDGKTSILELLGPGFTIVDFSTAGNVSDLFVSVSGRLRIPLERVHLAKEEHCRKIWQRDVVLVRPCGFVAWRAPPEEGWSAGADEVERILKIVVGKAGETF